MSLVVLLAAALSQVDSEEPQAQLRRAEEAFSNLEFEQAARIAAAVLARSDAGADTKLDASWIQGSALAIIGDPIEAEKPFRFLLRERPDFELPAIVPPKVAAVFRKVQVEEQAIRTQMREIARQRIIDQLEVIGDLPQEVTGGIALQLSIELRDPSQAVRSLRLHYRRKGDNDYSSLPLQPDDSGLWVGELAAEFTASPDGFEMEYYLDSLGLDEVELLSVGGPTTPRSVRVLPGEVVERSLLESAWFWIVVAGAVIAAGVTIGVVVEASTSLPDADTTITIDN